MSKKNKSLLKLTDQRMYSLIEKFINNKKGMRSFSEYELKGLLKSLGFSIPKGIFISKKDINQIPFPLPLDYPLAAKISSPEISSKSDAGGVILNIKNEEELKIAVEKLFAFESCEGILIEEMAPKGVEVIIGGIMDNQFGPVVMFGLGGIFVELFKDVAFALAPMDEKDARWLIKQVKGYKLIEGYRNQPPADMETLMEMIVSISKIMATGLILEIDLNPVVLYQRGALVLDAKMLQL